ncbi:MAG TPA: hypothetical protein VEZ46_05525 [Mycobacteriales bacterium]|nr:hypothetical protein [Mycobacteriales bacterium]
MDHRPSDAVPAAPGAGSRPSSAAQQTRQAHASYAVYTARTDDPPADLLLRADVPALDPAVWSLAVVPLPGDAPLRDVLSTLADERQPPIGRRDYPAVPTYRQAVLLDVGRDDSLHPDALAFVVGAVRALIDWADGPVVDLTAERVWPPREWRKKVAAKRFDATKHVSVHADWAEDGRTATVHTHGMAKFAHPDFVAVDVPDEGVRAVAQLFGHLASVRALTLEPLEPGHAFDPGFGQPMVAFVAADPALPVIEHLGAEPSVVVDTDLDSAEAVEGLYDLLRSVRSLDRPAPEGRRRWPLAAPDAPPPA